MHMHMHMCMSHAHAHAHVHGHVHAHVQALQDEPTASDLEELSLKLNAVEVAHYKSLEAATPEPKSATTLRAGD